MRESRDNIKGDLYVRYKGNWLLVLNSEWTDDMSLKVCEYLGLSNVLKTFSIPLSGQEISQICITNINFNEEVLADKKEIIYIQCH